MLKESNAPDFSQPQHPGESFQNYLIRLGFQEMPLSEIISANMRYIKNKEFNEAAIEAQKFIEAHNIKNVEQAKTALLNSTESVQIKVFVERAADGTLAAQRQITITDPNTKQILYQNKVDSDFNYDTTPEEAKLLNNFNNNRIQPDNTQTETKPEIKSGSDTTSTEDSNTTTVDDTTASNNTLVTFQNCIAIAFFAAVVGLFVYKFIKWYKKKFNKESFNNNDLFAVKNYFIESYKTLTINNLILLEQSNVTQNMINKIQQSQQIIKPFINFSIDASEKKKTETSKIKKWLYATVGTVCGLIVLYILPSFRYIKKT